MDLVSNLIAAHDNADYISHDMYKIKTAIRLVQIQYVLEMYLNVVMLINSQIICAW